MNWRRAQADSTDLDRKSVSQIARVNRRNVQFRGLWLSILCAHACTSKCTCIKQPIQIVRVYRKTVQFAYGSAFDVRMLVHLSARALLKMLQAWFPYGNLNVVLEGGTGHSAHWIYQAGTYM